VTISREEAYNALNKDVFDRLEAIFLELETDNDVMVVVVTGAGEKAFVAGADVKEVKEAIDDLAKKISSNGPLAIKAIKRAINGGIERPMEEALKLELTEYGKLAFSKDAEDGMVAFSEKRTPTFKGE